MRAGIDKVQALRYKLYIMGVPMDGPTYVFCDNQLVVLATQKPETRIPKKHNAFNYHRIRKSAAGKWIRVAFESGASNLADLLTKILPIGKRKDILLEPDAIKRGAYADLMVEHPKGVEAYEGRTSIDNNNEDRPSRNAWLSLWSMGTALILS